MFAEAPLSLTNGWVRPQRDLAAGSARLDLRRLPSGKLGACGRRQRQSKDSYPGPGPDGYRKSCPRSNSPRALAGNCYSGIGSARGDPTGNVQYSSIHSSAHNLAIIRNLQNKDEEGRREKTVYIGGPEQCPYGIDSCKIDQHPEQCREGVRSRAISVPLTRN